MQRSLADIANSFDTDKKQNKGYIDNFERHFGMLRDDPVTILELGVYHGGSLLMWHEYFSKGLVVGLDLSPSPLSDLPDRVRFYQGSQDDDRLLARMARECAQQGFDIVIDDASHLGTVTRASFRNLFKNHLKPGGIYVVEDWGTGYWGTWPDGKNYRLVDESRAPSIKGKVPLVQKLAKALRLHLSEPPQHLDTAPNFAAHNHGMVGFVKELVDEVAWLDVTASNRGNDALDRRPSLIREMTIYNGHAFVVRA